MTDIVTAAQAACDILDLAYQTVPLNGKFHRLDVKGKAVRSGDGTMQLFADGEGGIATNYITNETLLFWAKNEQSLTPVELEERKRRGKSEREQAEKELAESRAAAAALAKLVIKAAVPPVDNPYLLRKQVEPTATLLEMQLAKLVDAIGYHPAAKGKPFADGPVLIVLVKNQYGIATIEMIDCNGLKAGLKDGQKKGGFWSTSKLPDGTGDGLTIGIGEGVATMLTYHGVSGNIGIAALSCGNLQTAAKCFRDRYPLARLNIISDVGNGEKAAIEAARSVEGYLIKPAFPPDSADSDINDLFVKSGADAVRACIDAAVLVLPTELPPAPEATVAPIDQWPEPSPLPEGLPPVMKLTPEMIPVPFRGWLTDIAHRMQSAIDFAAASAIVALASVIGRGCGIYPKQRDSWFVVPNLFGAAIGDPSVMKTPTIAEGTRPLERLEIAAKQYYEEGLQAAEMAQDIEDITKTAAREKLKAAIKSGKSDKVAEAQAELMSISSVPQPTRRRFQTQDGTTEKIGELLNQNPRGILSGRDELVG